jgi:hypothetical protein
MKKLQLLIAFIFLSVYSFAQQEESTFYRPLQGDVAVSFNITGLANLTLNSTQDPLTNALLFDFRYFWKDNVAFRLGLGLNNISATRIDNDDPQQLPTVTNMETKSSISGFNIGLSIEKHVKTKSKKMDPYVGAGLFLGLRGDSTITMESKTTVANSTDYQMISSEQIIPGGSALGIGITGGFYWFFAPNIALGGELAIAYVTGHLGGESSTKLTTTNSVSGTVTTTETHLNEEIDTKFNALNTINTGSINLLVKF